MKSAWLVGSAALLLVAACGGSNEETTVPKGDGPSLAALLQAVPDTPEIRSSGLYYGNLTVLRDGERAGSLEEDMSLLTDRSSDRMFLPDVVRSGIGEPDFAQYAGFDTRQIEVALEFGSLPDSVAVLVGTMKASAIQSGLESSPGGDAVTNEQVGDVTYLSLGEDDKSDYENVSPIRRVGQPLRLAIVGDTVYWGRTRGSVEAAVGAAAGIAPSLGDDAGYLAVATAIDEAKAVNGLLVTPAAAESWMVAGLGETFQGDTSTITIALMYATPEMAAAAVASFRAHIDSGVSLDSNNRWSEMLTVVDALATGSLMVATLTSERPGIAVRAVLTHDNLLQF